MIKQKVTSLKGKRRVTKFQTKKSRSYADISTTEDANILMKNVGSAIRKSAECSNNLDLQTITRKDVMTNVNISIRMPVGTHLKTKPAHIKTVNFFI